MGITLGFILLTSFTNNDAEVRLVNETKNLDSNNEDNGIPIPFLQRDFIGFKEALAFKESQGKFNVVNKFGYLGKYQFGKKTLRRFKIYDTQSFLKNPSLQDKAFEALCKVNKWILRKEIKRFVGKRIKGITITESGILAASHLAGAGNVKKYLRSYGAYDVKDGFGTSIGVYLKKFAGYDVSNIEANKLATI